MDDFYLLLGYRCSHRHQLHELRPRNIVLMNPAYFREVTSSLQAIGLSTTLLTINQLVTEPREPEAGCA